MLNRMGMTQKKVTDFNTGAVIRTMIEAPAAELDELYQQMFNGLQQAIPVSVFNSFTFPPLPAQSASGLTQLTIAPQATAVLVSAGTTFTPTASVGSVYQSATDVVIPAGSTTVNIQIACTASGTEGNLPQGQTFSVSPQPTGFVSATNAAAFSNGLDAETPAQQLIRFQNYISTLPRGTVGAIQYGLSTVALSDANGNVIERVASSLVIEPYLTDPTQLPIIVKAYIFNGVGGTSADLVTQAQQVIYGYTPPNGAPVPGWKAAGIPCPVYAVTETPINVSGTLTVAPGYVYSNVEPLVAAAFSAYLLALPNGNSGNQPAGQDPVGTALAGQFTTLAFNIPGVANYVPSAPLSDALAPTGTKNMPGTITLTQGT
jgi:hypothetical protein